MSMRFKRNLRLGLALLAVGFGLLGEAGSADAGFRLRVEDIGANVGVVLTGTEVPANNPSGSITFVGSIGAFSVVVTTTVTQHSSPNNYAELDLNNITVTGGTAGTLRITAEDTDYTRGDTNPLALVALVGGTLTAGAGSSVTIQSWANGDNLVPNLGTDAGTTSTAVSLAGNPLGGTPAGSTAAFSPTAFTSGPGAFSGSGRASFVSGPPVKFSLFAQAILTFGAGGGIASFDDDQQVVPAPAGLLLAATGLPFLGLAWLRRRAKKPASA